MTERFRDSGLLLHPDQEAALMTDERRVSLLPTAAILFGKESGVLRADTNCFVRIKTLANGRLRSLPLGIIELGTDMSVALSLESPIPTPDELPLGSVSVNFVPSSPQRSCAVAAWNQAQEHFDGDAVFASRDAIRREDRRLAQEFVIGKEALMRKQGIDSATVTKVEITVGVNIVDLR